MRNNKPPRWKITYFRKILNEAYRDVNSSEQVFHITIRCSFICPLPTNQRSTEADAVVSSVVPAQSAQRERRQQLVPPLPGSLSPLAVIDYFPYGIQAAAPTPTFHATCRCRRRQGEAGNTETKGIIQYSGLHSEIPERRRLPRPCCVVVEPASSTRLLTPRCLRAHAGPFF